MSAARKALVALVSATVIMGVAGCGTSGAPQSTSSSSTSTPTSSEAPPVAAAGSACAEIGGTVGGEQTCSVHAETPEYTIDIKFPVGYPDQKTKLFTYDDRGNKKTETDENGHVTQFAYDQMNRLAEQLQLPLHKQVVT